ncbi:MAG: hypothetical protein JWQ63_1225 [Mucilaginibacter sp.]|nr:hypothetical protein [Mucilaginibacter sp.]
MLSPQSLRRPANWQDFETLCKKLWGEIWNCPEIKKNGRTGQAQYGVDVYGIPAGEEAYFAIQCKGKDEYTDKQFTESEIKEEINKALKFKPALKKLYFATTAVKDAPIEAFVREKHIENRAAGMFEVHLYCWEDIVDLIDENKATADWYIKNQNYKANHQAELTFEKGEKEAVLKPKFKQQRTIYRLPPPKINLGIGHTGFDQFFQMAARYQSPLTAGIVMQEGFTNVKVNLSYVPVDLWLHNTGNETLEDYKVYITVEGDINDITKDNKTGGLFRNIISNNYVPTTRVYSENLQVTLTPRTNVLVPGDQFAPETFYIKPSLKCSIVTLYYKLLSRHFRTEGQLIIHIQPDIDYKRTYVEVESEDEERTEDGPVEDLIERGDDE